MNRIKPGTKTDWIPGSVLNMYLSRYQYSFLTSGLYYTVILLLVRRTTFNSYSEFYTSLFNYKGISSIFEMCAVIVWNLEISGHFYTSLFNYKGILSIFEMCAVIVWNLEISDSFPCYFKMLYSLFG